MLMFSEDESMQSSISKGLKTYNAKRNKNFLVSCYFPKQQDFILKFLLGIKKHVFTKTTFVGYPQDMILLSNKGKPTTGRATSWIYLKSIELSEKVQTQVVTYYMFPFT